MDYCPHCMSPAGGRFCSKCGKPLFWAPELGQLPAGTVLEGGLHRYITGAALGQGGFGITYIALDPDSGNRVAVKECYPSNSAERDLDGISVIARPGQEDMLRASLDNFIGEARMLAKNANLPCVVRVLDFFYANGTAYLVMEYLDGVTLRQHMLSGGVFDAQRLLHDLAPLMRDLSQLHSVGVIHRDISPDNIMLMSDGRAKLLDFGSARTANSGGMQAVLKRGFAPIEQYSSQGQGPWTDVYALCATIYYCITGVLPPAANERSERDTLVPPKNLGANLSPRQESALMWGLAVQPSLRPQNIDQLARELFQPQADTTQSGQHRPTPDMSRQGQHKAAAHRQKPGFPKWLFAVFGGVAVAAVALVLLFTGVIGGRSGVTALGIEYRISRGEAALTGTDRALSGALELPGEIDGATVTSIADNAFAGQRSITSVTIPESVESIGDGAFADCTLLQVVCTGDAEVGDGVFSGSRNIIAVVQRDSFDLTGWAFPSDVLIYAKGDETGAGALDDLRITDDGAIYALTDEGTAVVMKVPNASVITIEESIDGCDVVWMNEHALDDVTGLPSIYPAAEMGYPYEIYDSATWELKDGNDINCFSFCWDMTCIVTTMINSLRDGEAADIVPVPNYVRAAMTRAGELSLGVSHDRPDGTSWSTVLDEQGLDPYYMLEWIDSFGISTQSEMADTVTDLAMDLYGQDSDYYVYYQDIGVATYLDLSTEEVYICAVAGAN